MELEKKDGEDVEENGGEDDIGYRKVMLRNLKNRE